MNAGPSRMRRGRPVQGALARASFALALALLTESASAEPPREFWSAVQEGQRIVWPPEPGQQPLELSLPAAFVQPDTLVLVKLQPGQWVRVTTPGVELGLGAGSAGAVDAISWLGSGTQPTWIPSWTQARWLVARRTDGPGPVALERAGAARDAFTWYRFDSAWAQWLRRDPDAPPPAAPQAAATLVDGLVATRRALDALPAAPVAAWLTAVWLDESLRIRPLASPYFSSPAVHAAGVPVDESGEGWLVEAGRELVLRGAADVLSLKLRPAAAKPTGVEIYEGSRHLRTLRFSAEHPPAAGTASATAWSAPRVYRVVRPAGEAALRIVARSGSCRVEARSYAYRSESLAAWRGVRDRAAQLSVAARQSAPQLIRLLAAARHKPTPAALTGLARAARERALPEGLRTVAHLERLLVGGEGAIDPWTMDRLARSLTPPSDPALIAPALEAIVRSRPDAHTQFPPASHGHCPLASLAGSTDASPWALLWCQLYPPSDGQRPIAANHSEAWARVLGTRHAAIRARRTWTRTAPRHLLLPTAATRSRLAYEPHHATSPGGECGSHEARGEAWLELTRHPASVLLAGPEGGLAQLSVRGEETGTVTREATAFIGRAPVPVHTLTPNASIVAVRHGRYDVSSDADPEQQRVLLRLPTTWRAPCAQLRSRRRWASTAPRATYELTGDGWPTAVEVVVRDAGPGARLRLSAGDASREAWLAPGAGGVVELPVPATATQLVVESDHAVEIRAYVRRHRSPVSAARPPSLAVAALDATQDSSETSVERALARLRQLGRSLLATPTDPSLLQQRARALQALGYASLANVDLAAAGISHPPPRIRQLRVDPALRVVPLNTLAKLPALASELPAADWARARTLARARAPGSSVLAAMPAATASSEQAPALLRALAAEQAELPLIAARAWKRLATAHDSAAAAKRAAEQFAKHAALHGDDLSAVEAYAMAKAAQARGEDVGGVLGTLGRAVRFAPAAGAAGSAGSVRVEHQRVVGDQPLGHRVRLAYLGAPTDAWLLTEGRRLEVRLDTRTATSMVLGSFCLDPLGPHSPCRLEWRLDGAPLCGQEPSAAPGSPASGATRASCQVTLPAGSHRLAATAPSESALAAATLEGLPGAFPEPTTLSRWLAVDPREPLALRFAGPTVLRLRARRVLGDSRGARRIWVKLPGRKEEPRELPEQPDPTSQRIAAPGAPLGQEAEFILPVFNHQVETLSIRAEGGLALLRVDAAVAEGLPELAPTSDATPASAPGPTETLSTPTRHPQQPTPEFVEAPARPWATLSAHLGYTDAQLLEADAERRERYVEVGASLRRLLLEGGPWARLTVFARGADRPASFGAEGALHFSSSEQAPGGWLRAHVVGQSLRGHVALGSSLSAGLYSALRVEADWRLIPWSSHVLRQTDDDARSRPGADRNVWSDYAEQRPRSLGVGATLRGIPWVDVRAATGPSLHTTSGYTTIDRYDWSSEVDWLAGSGRMPWLAFQLVASHRPHNEVRARPFTRVEMRPKVVLWSWLSSALRSSLAAELGYLRDFPATSVSGAVSGFLLVSFDETSGRGLGDFSPSERPFTDRLEEGRGDSTWSNSSDDVTTLGGGTP